VARVHPHEAFGACTLTPLPVRFEQAAAATVELLALSEGGAPDIRSY
jgi:hypothetical protein